MWKNSKNIAFGVFAVAWLLGASVFSSAIAGSPSSPGVGPLNVAIVGGNAGGDLSGTYPNPTVAKINTASLGSTTATAGNLLVGSGTAWVTKALSGDCTLASTGAITCTKTNGSNLGTMATQNANAVALTGGTATGITSVAIGGTLAASSVIDVHSTTKGALLPRMTTTQKDAISAPAEGLIVYDTTLHKLCVYTGAAWETITSVAE